VELHLVMERIDFQGLPVVGQRLLEAVHIR
jgi:hypothetical protein